MKCTARSRAVPDTGDSTFRTKRDSLVLEERNFPRRDVEALLLCLRKVCALVDGELRVVDEGISQVIVLRAQVLLLVGRTVSHEDTQSSAREVSELRRQAGMNNNGHIDTRSMHVNAGPPPQKRRRSAGISVS